MRIVRGPHSGYPILLLPNGYAYLSAPDDPRMAGRYMPHSRSQFRECEPYSEPLTDTEEAVAMKVILLHGSGEAP